MTRRQWGIVQLSLAVLTLAIMAVVAPAPWSLLALCVCAIEGTALLELVVEYGREK